MLSKGHLYPHEFKRDGHKCKSKNGTVKAVIWQQLWQIREGPAGKRSFWGSLGCTGERKGWIRGSSERLKEIQSAGGAGNYNEERWDLVLVVFVSHMDFLLFCQCIGIVPSVSSFPLQVPNNSSWWDFPWTVNSFFCYCSVCLESWKAGTIIMGVKLLWIIKRSTAMGATDNSSFRKWARPMLLLQ